MFRFFYLGYKRGLVASYVWSSLLLAGLLPATALAQSAPLQVRAALRGTVANERGAPVEMATLTLHRAADSVAVKTEFSDAKGDFVFDALAAGSYRLSVTQVGYARYWSAPLEVTAAGLTLGSITLKASAATALQEVTVTARKPLYEHTPNGTSVNVADNPLSAGATTLEVLSRSPGVTLDAVSNLALRGRQGLLVVIDGRRTPLTGVELADYLRALPAEQVQSLELLTNPPAQYDAQGGAGVIIITLKKDQRLGTNGSVNASYGHGRYGKFVGGLSLNQRGKNYNLYGNYSYADRGYFTDYDFTRTFAATPARAAASSVLNSNQHSQLHSHTAKVGFDLNLSKRTLLGASVGGLVSRVAASTSNQTELLPTGSTRFRSINEIAIRRPSFTANLNLRHSFADSANARSLSADADVARYHTARLNTLITTFDPAGQDPSLLYGDQGNTLLIRAAKVDYGQPLPHRLRLEAGAKATLVTSDNNVTFTQADPASRRLTVDTAISKPFYYRENVNAAYLTLRGVAAGTSLQAGLRAEQTNLRATQGPLLLREQHYLQLFPSLLLERTLGRNNALALSLARRIDRPSYAQLNPLRAYLDATSYSVGNSGLVASTSLNVELTHTYKGKFSTALAYARTNQPIILVSQPSPDGGYLVANGPVNLSTQDFYTLTLTAPLELRKWWTAYATALFYYNHYTGTLADTRLDRGGFATNLTFNNSFVLPGGWSADINALYESREVFNFQVIRNRGRVDVGLQKSLWHKQGTLRLNVSDVFYTTPLRYTATYDSFAESAFQRQDTRVATLALTYRFGNSKVAAARKRAAGADDELRRAGTGQ